MPATGSGPSFAQLPILYAALASGVVLYAVTRAEDDPAMAAAEPWEPGIPRIQVALYWDLDRDGQLDVVAAINHAWDLVVKETGPSLEVWFNDGPR